MYTYCACFIFGFGNVRIIVRCILITCKYIDMLYVLIPFYCLFNNCIAWRVTSNIHIFLEAAQSETLFRYNWCRSTYTCPKIMDPLKTLNTVWYLTIFARIAIRVGAGSVDNSSLMVIIN